jgi:hypothetical protein
VQAARAAVQLLSWLRLLVARPCLLAAQPWLRLLVQHWLLTAWFAVVVVVVMAAVASL